PSTPLLGVPVHFDEFDRPAGPGTEEAPKARQDLLAPLGLGQSSQVPRLCRLGEADQDPGVAGGGRVVEDHPYGASVRACLPTQSFGSPERLVVDREHLDHRAHRRGLGEMVAVDRKRRVVADTSGQYWRGRDDGLTAPYVL